MEHGDGPADGTYLMRIGVTYTGGSNYILQGMVEVPDDNPVILDGTAIIIGNEVFITMNSFAWEPAGLPVRVMKEYGNHLTLKEEACRTNSKSDSQTCRPGRVKLGPAFLVLRS
jgi:hypothetical protein